MSKKLIAAACAALIASPALAMTDRDIVKSFHAGVESLQKRLPLRVSGLMDAELVELKTEGTTSAQLSVIYRYVIDDEPTVTLKELQKSVKAAQPCGAAFVKYGVNLHYVYEYEGTQWGEFYLQC